MEDRRRRELERAIGQALRPYLPTVSDPATDRAIELDVANFAELLIETMYGNPDAPKPQGIVHGSKFNR